SALVARRQTLSHAESTASVDSELMLLWWPDYPLARQIPNPLYWQVPEFRRQSAPTVLMTARLDGPTPEIAKGLVDQAIAVEAAAAGLTGKAYVDARGIRFDPKKPGEAGIGHEGYDESFRETAALLKKGGMDVVLDDRDPVFPPKSCPGAALYVGWYSHAKFVDTCEFVPGAVAWHLASSEAVTLRKADSPVWCPNLLKKGVAATIGPVAEPYTVGFPKPAEFFGFLGTGKYTLVECYARTVYFASWMGVLVGDPLYNPFRRSPILKVADVVSSPIGAPPLIR
ncbi:MAG: TIGR03790 family protein, partial [Fimbriiglobus sp.]